MRIVVVIPHLGLGGAERVCTLLCNWWSEHGHSVSAITFEAPGVEPSFFGLDKGIKQHKIDALNCESSLSVRVAVNARRLWRLRSSLRALRPDVVVAFMTEASVLTVLAALGLGIPTLVTERNQPDRPGLGRFRRLARRLSYPWASAIVVQTNEIAHWAKSRFRLPVYVLPNPVKISGSKEVARNHNGRLVIGAGRLVHQKGFDLLIESFARVAESHPNWRLVIYGEGPERARLKAQIERNCLSDRIALGGLFTDVEAVFSQADLFVLPSRFEGYPNVLLEALSLSVPVIATDCPGATSAILDGGRYGLLVQPEDMTALAEALHCMMSNATLREQYAVRASHAVADLDVARIGSRWLDLFSSLKA
jgi:GalNAc-alpha-(1->4)-GalNAc-alpha-(1->3)-diNAcBac-PP-undecaprenol alpha-1,4-N-acetyl-D-galactosaminyltransferase